MGTRKIYFQRKTVAFLLFLGTQHGSFRLHAYLTAGDLAREAYVAHAVVRGVGQNLKLRHWFRMEFVSSVYAVVRIHCDGNDCSRSAPRHGAGTC